MKKLTTEAKELENNLNKAMFSIFKKYVEIYPNLEYKSSISKLEIAKRRGLKQYRPQNLKSNIRPDGGMIFLNEHMLLCSEAKTQGGGSGMGNAIERSAKNYLELSGLCKNQNYLPYIIFCSGKDFSIGSSILDRIDVLTDYNNRNSINSDKMVASVYTKNEDFIYSEIYDILNQIIESSLSQFNYDRKKF